jgi:S1-C subfamily serine protease
VRAALLFVVALALSCATAAPPPLGEGPTPAPVVAPPAAPEPPPATCDAFARAGVLRRAAVNRAVDAGLGRWLSGVEVDPDVQKGRFRGWVIRRLYPGDVCYREVDLQPGDVVLRINGKSIERPEQANEVFRSLTTAPAVVVEFLRAGAARQLTFPIE